MAATYPYTLTPKKLPILFDLIAKRGVPDVADDTWLKQVGLTTDNDRRFLSVLRQIGFTDTKGKTTQLWRDYRGPGGKKKLAEGIREGYKDLFEMFPDANLASDAEVTSFIRGHTNLGDATIRNAVATFKGLVALADFGQGASSSTPSEPVSSNGTADKPAHEEAVITSETAVQRRQSQGVTININLQLTLPESTDPAVYDALFAALGKHLLQNET